MECLEFTNCLECGAKIPHQIQMCSQITANLLRVTFWYLFIHQLSLTFFFSCWPTPTDGFVPRTFIPCSVKRFWKLGAACMSLPMPSPAVPTAQKSRAMGWTPPAFWIPFPLTLHGHLTQAVANSLEEWPSHLEAIHQCVSSVPMRLKLSL